MLSGFIIALVSGIAISHYSKTINQDTEHKASVTIRNPEDFNFQKRPQTAESNPNPRPYLKIPLLRASELNFLIYWGFNLLLILVVLIGIGNIVFHGQFPLWIAEPVFCILGGALGWALYKYLVEKERITDAQSVKFFTVLIPLIASIVIWWNNEFHFNYWWDDNSTLMILVLSGITNVALSMNDHR